MFILENKITKRKTKEQQKSGVLFLLLQVWEYLNITFFKEYTRFKKKRNFKE